LRNKLIVFDYSGTLSLEAVSFSRSDNLLRQLRTSGLFALGVDSTGLFWKIINESWIEGSTTSAGYKTIMRECIYKLFPEKTRTAEPEISRAVSGFVDAYLDCSRIDDSWRGILEKLSQNNFVQVVIATDHYAEATEAIIAHLGKWNITAAALADNVRNNFVVANSAGIGWHKDKQQFWQAVKDALPFDYTRVLLIDDFGRNEQAGDAYGNITKVDKRRRETINMLSHVFGADIETLSFVIDNNDPGRLIAETSAMIERFLSE
jgi:hypothetical protein